MIELGPNPKSEMDNKIIVNPINQLRQNPKSGWENQSNTGSSDTKFVYNEKERTSPFITATELFAMEYDEIPTLVGPIFPKIGIVALVGSSDTGKSSILRQLAYLVAEGSKTFLGFPIHAIHNRSIYVSTEDEEISVSTLLKKQFGKPLDKIKTGRLKYLFESDDLLKKLDEEMTKYPVDLVVIDAFSDLYEGDLNANNKVRTFLNKYSDLAKKHRCLIIFLHHTGKRTDYLAPGKDNAIGSQGFEAKMRLMIELRKDPKFPNIRHLCVVKGNYLPENYKTHSIVMNFNEYMLFENLNCYVPFEELAKISDKKEEAQTRAHQLREQGNSYTKITEQLKKEGYDFGRSTVGEWLKGE